MSATAVLPGALEASQRYLGAQLERMRVLLDGARNGGATPSDLDAVDRSIASARVAIDGEPALDFICAAFHLTSFERDVLVLSAGVELDAELAERCAATGGAGPYATFGIALEALPDAHWSALAPARPLRRWRLIEVGETAPLAVAPLRIDERILHFLAGLNVLDARLRPWLRDVDRSEHVAPSHDAAAEQIADVLREVGWAGPIVQLHGDDRDGKTDVASLVATRLGRPLFALAGEDVPTSPPERFDFATLVVREHVLFGAALFLDGHEQARLPEDLLRLLVSPLFVGVRFPLATQLPAIRFRVDRPTALERRRLWETALGPVAGRNGEELDAISAQYRLSARAICSAAAEARFGDGAALDGALASLAGFDDAHRALDALAQRLDPRAEWDDLVVPAAVRDSLRQIAAQVRLQSRVYEEWGLGSKIQWGLAITALFTGESGTGKTLAAEVLAAEIRLPLYRIDLSSVVSKYIGETEKHLRGVFEAAEACRAILLFDEADALFGRRSDVRDSHDRYANIEVSYLLQRIEAYRGLAILTTNAKATIDRAFYRRLRFVVEFPFPDAAQRERIWRAVFPSDTPLADIDHAKLARLNVSGGGIRNIAVNAAFRAASAGSAVSMAHILDAARAEFAKAGKALVEAETRGWTSP